MEWGQQVEGEHGIEHGMKIIAVLRLILKLVRELFGYGKKVEKEKLEAKVDDRRRDKRDWIDERMSDGAAGEAGRDEGDHPGQ